MSLDKEFNIDITQDAIKRVKELIELEKNSNLKLRVTVDGGGCSGFQYKYDLVEETSEDDFLLIKNDVSVVIDSMSQEFLHNSVIEYIQDLGNSYFRVRNPSAVAKCGCGQSFAV